MDKFFCRSQTYLFSVLGRTLSGFRFNGPPTQGSSFLATLGWRTQSLWDWEGAKHILIPRRRGWDRVGLFGRKFRQFGFIDFANFIFLALPGFTRLDERMGKR